ncbi:STE20 [Candida metapsilosis]|uniref:STE20 n=1 Tax=Candida metapsilosis TaxID=273372 RepID=A0A8H7ZHJ9_9ASCO|nr:STE20 [Candida metapsilosis]
MSSDYQSLPAQNEWDVPKRGDLLEENDPTYDQSQRNHKSTKTEEKTIAPQPGHILDLSNNGPNFSLGSPMQDNLSKFSDHEPIDDELLEPRRHASGMMMMMMISS